MLDPHSHLLLSLYDTHTQNRQAPPCALCSACRDWNLGEFCPWDLTGSIGADEIPMTATGNSLDGSTAEVTAVTNTTSTITMDFEGAASSVAMNFSIPQEISHSTSAADFMADIETW